MSDVASPEVSLTQALKANGHVYVLAREMRAMLENKGELARVWRAFADSWTGMPVDEFMADGGRYRRRRHAVFSIDPDLCIRREPHQPHFQSRAYNALNGGVARWFEPIPADIAASVPMTRILQFASRIFSSVAGVRTPWFVEVHQFRIEAKAGEEGLPTPEGVHRDGVDFVLVLLVTRCNIAQGVTEIFAPGGERLGQFTLSDAFDTVLLDDHRVYHGVTAVRPLDPATPAWRDVIVVTFRAEEPAPN